MNLARVDEALLQARQELIEDPRQGVEGLDTAPTSGTWRSWLSDQPRKASRRAVAAVQKPPRFWTWGIPHAQLGLCMARLKESNDD
jgi:hypothetical protein